MELVRSGSLFLVIAVASIMAQVHDVSPEVRQAVLLKNAGHAIKAEAILRTVLHQHPDSIPAMDELGLVLQAQGRRQEALLLFKKILKAEPDNAGVYSNMGICLEAMDRDDEALSAFKKAIELQPNLRSAHVDIANYYRYHNHLPKAIRHLKRAIEITPTDPIAHGGLGAVLSDMENWDEAEAQYRVLLKLAPRNVHGITELGNVLLRKGHTDRAIKRFEKALELSGGSWVRAMDGMGRAYREKGNLVEAEKYAKMAVAMRPVDVQSRDVLASVYQAEGHSKRAANEYATALRYNPTDQVASKRLPKLIVSMEKKDPNVKLPANVKQFGGVDLGTDIRTYPHEHLMGNGDEPTAGSSDSAQYILIGALVVVVGAALAIYLQCWSGNNEGYAPGYAPVGAGEEDDLYQSKGSFPGKDSLYEL